MAQGTSKGGAQHFTVQEAQNATLGQVGSMFNDGSGAIVAPTGHVFIAITFLTDTQFDGSTGLVSVDSDGFINTGAAANPLDSSGGTIIDGTNVFPAGLTIYGRWTTINPVSTAPAGGLIAYIGK